MRDIRYRAWNSNGFDYWDGNNHDDHAAYVVFAAGPVDRPDPEQFTGLQDKNGVDIWEWDIVTMNGAFYTIVWEKKQSRFSMRCANRHNRSLITRRANKCEVIGNIHQNQEVK